MTLGWKGTARTFESLEAELEHQALQRVGMIRRKLRSEDQKMEVGTDDPALVFVRK